MISTRASFEATTLPFASFFAVTLPGRILPLLVMSDFLLAETVTATAVDPPATATTTAIVDITLA
jgi:hypothetical protein